MHPDQPLPRLWLMTDERLGEGLRDAVARLPEEAGIVFRHYSLDEGARRALFDTVRAAHPGPLLLSAPADLAAAWDADGSHGRHAGAVTAPAHNLAEIRLAEAIGARLIFLSPVYPTRSHPDASGLGAEAFATLAAQTGLPVVALGGMNAARAKTLSGAYGWAGIDAWAWLEAQLARSGRRFRHRRPGCRGARRATHRIEPVAGDPVAGAGGHIDVAGDPVGAADVEQ